MDVNEQHARCASDLPKRPKRRQHILVNNMGVLCLGPPSEQHYQRTPAPNRVRRMARSPTFSTTDPSLTAFLRFPPEVRLKIYRLLLHCDDDLAFPLCPAHPRLVYRPGWKYRSRKAVRHRLFPSILECCRTTYMEASPILYGENWFQMEHRFVLDYMPHVEQTWPVARHSLREITKLTVQPPWHLGYSSQSPIEFLQIPLMHSLKIMEFTLPGMSATELREFLVMTMSHVNHVPQLTLEITMRYHTINMFHHSYPQIDAKNRELLCITGYEPAVLKGISAPQNGCAGLEGTEVWPMRQISWELNQDVDENEITHGLIGYLFVHLTQEGVKRVLERRVPKGNYNTTD